MDLIIDEPLSLGGVFLSFNRGETTRESFCCSLRSSLKRRGISVPEEEISIELLRSTIESSKISLIIFSKYYASSRRCLEELTKIMEFRTACDHIVIPIFYGVDRSDVRDLKSSFGEAFRDLIQRISPTENEVSSWRKALNGAGGHYGFVVPDFKSKAESMNSIRRIANHVLEILITKGTLFVTNHPDGVNSRDRDAITMLDKHESKDVLSIGIWGMGGIGKTTIARTIFNHIQYEFETSCFLSSEIYGRGKSTLFRKYVKK